MFDNEDIISPEYCKEAWLYTDVKTISPHCIYCKRLDVDTIAGEKYRIIRNPDGSTSTVPDGYHNTLICKNFDECKMIFENGYKVTKEEIPNLVFEANMEEIAKIEKKPATRKRTTRPKAEEKKPTKTKKGE